MGQTLDTMAEKVEMDKTGDTLSQLCIDAAVELQKACNKFPLFADKFTTATLEGVRSKLADARQTNDAEKGRKATCDTILLEEYCEMAEAVMVGDAHAARKEIVQCIAMLMRTYVHLPHYCGFRQK